MQYFSVKTRSTSKCSGLNATISVVILCSSNVTQDLIVFDVKMSELDELSVDKLDCEGAVQSYMSHL